MKKKDVSMNGIGLSNEKREVGKYMGDMDIKLKKNEFRVTFLLQERSSHEFIQQEQEIVICIPIQSKRGKKQIPVLWIK